MNIWKTLHAFHQAARNQRLHRSRIEEIQLIKLKRIVRHAYENTLFYRKLFEEGNISPHDIRTLEDLKKLPIVTRNTLQALDERTLLSRTFRPHALKSEHSSGSTGRPFTVLFDDDYTYFRNALFLRALRTTGYRFGHRLLLITSRGRKSKPALRWKYASIEDPPEALLREVNHYRPHFLYGCTTPLRQIAEYVRITPSALHRPQKVITTAEMLDAHTRTILAETFHADVLDFYGTTEMGLVGWECPEHRGYHLAEDSVIVEFLPLNGASTRRIVMTNLELKAMPLIRYDTGDTAPDAPDESVCPCGRTFRLLERVEGRAVDFVKLRDGRMVSPYRLTCSLEKIDALRRFQIIQEDYSCFTVIAEAEHHNDPALPGKIADRLRSAAGDEIQVSVVVKPRMEKVPGTKFRVVASRLQ